MKRILSFLRTPLTLYRVAHWLGERRVPVLPSLIDYFSRFVYACWLPHTATIGKRVSMGYGALGVVIHNQAVIGDDVGMSSGVTLGGNMRDYGAPKICDHVYIGSGAKILGPVTVGEGSIVGANCVVIKDVPPKCVVVGVPQRIVKENIPLRQHPTGDNADA